MACRGRILRWMRTPALASVHQPLMNLEMLVINCIK